MPELARSFEMVPDGSGYRVLVDGKDFPWHIAAEPLVVTASDETAPMKLVTVTLLVEGGVTIPDDMALRFG